MSDQRRPTLFARYMAERAPRNAPACSTETMFEDRLAFSVSLLPRRLYSLYHLSVLGQSPIKSAGNRNS